MNSVYPTLYALIAGFAVAALAGLPAFVPLLAPSPADAGSVSKRGGASQALLASDQERVLLEQTLQRLRGHAAAMPVPVTNTMNSLDQTVAWSFECPSDARVEKINVQIATRQITWDRSRLGNHPIFGAYHWDMGIYAAGGIIGTITANNWLMLDADYVEAAARRGEDGEIENEDLLYHELLHGELQILAMGTAQWQRKACNLELDLSHSDEHHRNIEPAVREFLRNRERLIPGPAAG